MSLKDFETFILSNVEELSRECAHLCKSDYPHFTLTLDIEKVYEGCEYCLIYVALDHLNLPTLSLSTGTEYVILNDAVVEVLENGIALYSISEFEERINDLLEFGAISEDEARTIREWIESRLSKH